MEEQTISGNNIQEYRLSWLAYIRPVITYVVGVAIFSAVFWAKGFASLQVQQVLATPLFAGGACVIIVVSTVLFALKLIYLKTLHLYINENGVFLSRGIFPWTKGSFGTLWRDISDANYFTGFIAWATKSYTVRIGHRFTKSSEIFVSNIKNGHQAVIAINEKIKAIARNETR